MITYEQGPIRPPSEAGSLLLRFTRNCPWNRCTFCPVYKGQQFSRRSLEEIKADIDSIHRIIEELGELSQSLGSEGQLNGQVLNTVMTSPTWSACHGYIAMWLAQSRGTVFIQDANSLLMPTRTLVEALEYLKARIPGVRRVTSYARSKTLTKKSVGELREIREAGLDRIHIGLESGSDTVLEFVQKGCTARDHIEAGRRVVEAGITLSEYVMPGLGGTAWSREHATETARVLNAIDPHFIRLRSLRIPPHAPLSKDLSEGRFTPLSDDETVREIRLLVESLDGIHSTLTSDHIMNLLQEVEGTLPDGKATMLAAVDRYLELPREERLLYRFGRRGGALQSIDDLCNPHLRRRLEAALDELRTEANGDLEQIITELGDQFI